MQPDPDIAVDQIPSLFPLLFEDADLAAFELAAAPARGELPEDVQ
jgi:hypothetical protein